MYNVIIYAGSSSIPGASKQGMVNAVVWNLLQNTASGINYLRQGYVLFTGNEEIDKLHQCTGSLGLLTFR